MLRNIHTCRITLLEENMSVSYWRHFVLIVKTLQYQQLLSSHQCFSLLYLTALAVPFTTSYHTAPRLAKIQARLARSKHAQIFRCEAAVEKPSE